MQSKERKNYDYGEIRTRVAPAAIMLTLDQGDHFFNVGNVSLKLPAVSIQICNKSI